MFLHQIKMVDMKHSKWDKQKSNPDKGRYVFTDKKYVNYGDNKNKLDYFWEWGDVDPLVTAHMENAWGYSVVRKEDNLFWPEGLPPDAEGRYAFRDALLMKIRIEDYVAKRKPEIEQSERAAMSKFEQFKAGVEEDGRRARMKPQDIAKLVDDIVIDERKVGLNRPLVRPKKLYPDTR